MAFDGARLKRFRLARGMSLDDLVAAIDGCVSKQALSKYERGLMTPSVVVLTKLAAAFGVKVMRLVETPKYRIEIVNKRR